jgi:hypothetical protein
MVFQQAHRSVGKGIYGAFLPRRYPSLAVLHIISQIFFIHLFSSSFLLAAGCCAQDSLTIWFVLCLCTCKS